MKITEETLISSGWDKRDAYWTKCIAPYTYVYIMKTNDRHRITREDIWVVHTTDTNGSTCLSGFRVTTMQHILGIIDLTLCLRNNVLPKSLSVEEMNDLGWSKSAFGLWYRTLDHKFYIKVYRRNNKQWIVEATNEYLGERGSMMTINSLEDLNRCIKLVLEINYDLTTTKV